MTDPKLTPREPSEAERLAQALTDWNKTWPIGTNLLTAEQARAMLRHVLCIEQSEGEIE